MKKNLSESIITKLNETEYQDYRDISNDNPLIEDMIAMFEEFGWNIEKSGKSIVVNDGLYKVQVDFKLLGELPEEEQHN